MMSVSIKERLRRVLICYMDIGKSLFRDNTGLTSNSLIRMSLVICIFFSVCIFVRLGKVINSKGVKLFYFGILLFLPIGINLIYPMTSDNFVNYEVARYSMVFLWIIPIYLIELQDKYEISQTVYIWMRKIVLVCIVVVSINYIYFNNSIYLKISFLPEQANSYFTVLIAQIKFCEGYKDEMPIAFIGERGIQDLTFSVNDQYNSEFISSRSDLKDWINDYAYIEYMQYHCGFAPTIVELEEIMTSYDEIERMPVYPDNGSIKVIDNKVIVKVSEVAFE